MRREVEGERRGGRYGKKYRARYMQPCTYLNIPGRFARDIVLIKMHDCPSVVCGRTSASIRAYISHYRISRAAVTTDVNSTFLRRVKCSPDKKYDIVVIPSRFTLRTYFRMQERDDDDDVGEESGSLPHACVRERERETER